MLQATHNLRYVYHVPTTGWTRSWGVRINEIDPEILLVHEVSKARMELRECTVPVGGQGSFTNFEIAEGDHIGFY